MGLSPAQRHSQRIEMERQLARQEATNSATSLHMQLLALYEDVARVQSLPTIADRIELKRTEMLPRWMPTVQAYLDAGKVYRNPVFAWCVVWLFDVGDFEQALDWADIAISQEQPTPDDIKSTFPAFVADTVLAWADDTLSRGESVEPYFSRTFEKVTSHWRLHEEITAKWLKFAGLMLLRDDRGEARATAHDDVELLEKADALLAAAESRHKKVGVGTVRKSIAARIRSLSNQQ
ncbi:phage terminase small subunit [Erwinia sp. AnSW2-5]|uniref:phage terminase small subunit n=1 Tax=Erwinia sp. AnSW2-5 TaxID=3367692 RepID=UPI00385EBCAD